MKRKKVVWSKEAQTSLKNHHDFIKKESVKAARMVKSEIINSSKLLPEFPEKYQVDEYYPSNSGNIRRYYKWSYRIIYEVNESTIDILNVLHTSQEPHQK